MQKFVTFFDASWTRFFFRFWRILGGKMEPNLEPRWDQKSISQKTWKNAFGASPLVPNWVQGIQVGSKNQPKIDPNMESKMECILASIFDTFQWILGGKLGGKMDQKSIQKGIGKRIQKRNDFWLVLEFFWGGAPRAGYGGGWIVRPPKTNQTPLELGKWTWVRTGTRAWARVFGV